MNTISGFSVGAGKSETVVDRNTSVGKPIRRPRKNPGPFLT